MKYCFLLLSCCFSYWTWAQSIGATLLHNGLLRTYTVYIPANYSNSQPCPVVLNLHGYGSNASQQAAISGMNSIADTAGFMVVYPEGTVDLVGRRYWNAAYGQVVDDIDFINQLLDTLIANYAIDPQRIYATGLSNGAIMSNTLACALNGRIAAIAGVAGTMSVAQQRQCITVAAMPVLLIHGTMDRVVPYGGNTLLLGVDSLVQHWRRQNSLNAAYTVTPYPNIVSTDSSTAELLVYGAGTTSPVHLIKINNGGHSWPSSSITIDGFTNMDVNASIEIWHFFRQFSKTHNAQQQLTKAKNGIENWRVLGNGVLLEWLQNKTSYLQVCNAWGQVLLQQKREGSGLQHFSLPDLPRGLYWISYQQKGQLPQSFSFIKS